MHVNCDEGCDRKQRTIYCGLPGYLARGTAVLEYSVPVYVFICSFVFRCSFGRKSNDRFEQALRSEFVALECVHT